jgi:hypothetical protein
VGKKTGERAATLKVAVNDMEMAKRLIINGLLLHYTMFTVARYNRGWRGNCAYQPLFLH